MSDAIYAYAVVRAGAVLPVLTGLAADGAPVLLAGGEVAAVVSRVPRSAFTGERAADPAWIAGRASAHHAVAAALPAPVLPLAFGALFSSPAAILDWLARRASDLSAALDRVDGASEWTLSVSFRAGGDPHVDQGIGRVQQSAGLAAAGPGLAFLRARSSARAARERSAAEMAHAAARARGVMARHARALWGSSPAWTALVSNERSLALREALSSLADDVSGQDIVLSLSGPWPPYAAAREIAHERDA